MSNIRDESHKDPRQLEQEIDARRDHLTRTISELEEKFSPGELFEQAMKYGKSYGGDFSHNLVESVRNNPVPAVLTAVGVMWMMYGQKRPQRYYEYEEHDYAGYDSPSNASYGVDPAYEPLSSIEGGAGTGASGTMGESKGKSGELKGRAHDMKARAGERVGEFKGKATSWKDHMSSSMGEARHRAGASAQRASDRMHRGADHARSSAQRANQGLHNLMQEQPLAVGAMGVAIGALIGASLPSTRAEDRAFGSTRDKVADRASKTARESYEKASEAGRRVAEHAKEDLKAEAKALKSEAKAESESVKSEVKTETRTEPQAIKTDVQSPRPDTRI